jgi:mannose-6-phosphate isomerase
MPLAPFRLSPWFSPRPWGSRSLLPWFDLTVPERCEPIGEAWLTSKDCIIESGPHRGHTLGQLAAQHPKQLLGTTASHQDAQDYPLLLKFIFPREQLSVQVHPDDEMAQALGQPRGKTECWYCVESSKGSVALGLKAGVTEDSVREAVQNNSLEQLLNWERVAAGDMVFVDAGTVHAIGPGVVLLETQQQSDITYRLYDYGRPRELHIDLALKAMRLKTAAGKVEPQRLAAGEMRLIQQTYFTVDRYDLRAGETRSISAAAYPLTLVSLTGDATLDGQGSESVMLGHAQAIVLPPADAGAIYELRAREDAIVICASPAP